MNIFFSKSKKLQNKHLREIVLLCASVAVLLLLAGFIASGGISRVSNLVATNNVSVGTLTASVFPCSWFGSCGNNSWVYALSANGYSGSTPSYAPGTSVTLLWQGQLTFAGGSVQGTCQGSSGRGVSYTCSITPQPGNFATGDFGIVGGTFIVNPVVTTTYVFCSTYINTHTLPAETCKTVTVPITPVPPPPPPPVNPAPSVTIDAGAGPGVTRTITAGTSVTINATFTPGGTDTLMQTSIIDSALNAVPGISTAVPPANKSYTFTPAVAGSYVFYPSVKTTSYPAWNNYGKSVTIVVNPAAGVDTCTDIPGNQSSVPGGCVGPLPSSPGSCLPTGGSYTPAANTCTCPVGTVLSGNACVPAVVDVCTNIAGNQSSAPANGVSVGNVCSCNVGYNLSGGVCVAGDLCTNLPGNQSSVPSNCTQQGNGTCSADPGYVIVGAACVQGGVIQSFTANPIRVRKGGTASVSWSTLHMSSCQVTELTSSGVRTLSSSRNANLTPVVNSKTVYTLTCSDASGASYSASATVNLIPETIER